MLEIDKAQSGNRTLNQQLADCAKSCEEKQKQIQNVTQQLCDLTNQNEQLSASLSQITMKAEMDVSALHA